MSSTQLIDQSASSRGRLVNTGNGPTLQPIDIGHSDYMGLLEPNTAFWSLIRREKLADMINDSTLLQEYQTKVDLFAKEMEDLRFNLTPSAVYFNPTERCNLNCSYCYIPEKMRLHGKHMSEERLVEALQILHEYFQQTIPDQRVPQIVFHGAEPLMNRKAVFRGIEAFGKRFRFGVQTNATLLDSEAIEFLTCNEVGIGLSLDGPAANVSNRTRTNWNGSGVFEKVEKAIDNLRGYPGFNVICTVTSENMRDLTDTVDYFHQHGVKVCMLNPVRCTLSGARKIKPTDGDLTLHYLKALDRTYDLYQKTGRKLVVANFANVLVSIIAPTARRLMCDISPCGAGRCFFSLAPNGDLFPCSEFIGLPNFKGGNLFALPLQEILTSKPFKLVKDRKVENIHPCRSCAVRHFCGSPCPAEAFEIHGAMDYPGAFCELYEEQVRYALRLVADEKAEAFLWDSWDQDTEDTFSFDVQ